MDVRVAEPAVPEDAMPEDALAGWPSASRDGTPSDAGLDQDVVLDQVEKSYPCPPPPVFSRGERLARLGALLRRVLARPPRAASEAQLAPRQPALLGISLNVAAGTALGICGDRGAGKTSLLRILAGLERPTAGRAILAGLVAGVFSLTEGPCHRQLSVRDNVLLTATRLGLDRDWVRRNLLAPGGAADYAHVAGALNTPLGLVPREAYWRFAWALAVACDPQVLLLDEIPIGLDAALADDIRREVAARQSAGRTVIIAGSQPALLATHCSWIVHLERGRLVDPPPPDEPALSNPAAAAAATTTAAVASPPAPQVIGPLEWYWVCSPEDGWAAYLRLAPANAEKRRTKGQRLIPAKPPWLDERGGCPADPWWPDAGRSPLTRGGGYADALRENQDLELA